MTPIDKRLTSHAYRKRIKAFTQAVKHLRNLPRIPRTPARPVWGATRPATKEERAALEARQEAHDARWSVMPDKATLHALLEVMTDDSPRRRR